MSKKVISVILGSLLAFSIISFMDIQSIINHLNIFVFNLTISLPIVVACSTILHILIEEIKGNQIDLLDDIKSIVIIMP